MYKCVDSEKEIWFELGKCTMRKHHSVLQDHLIYIRNGIVKPFHVIIICYDERDQDINDLEKQLPQSSTKGKSFEEANRKVCDK